MMVVVVYDISKSEATAAKRLRKVVNICEKYGVRVQKSVFECQINAEQYRRMLAELQNAVHREADSVRCYLLGNRYQNRMATLGKNLVEWDRENYVI